MIAIKVGDRPVTYAYELLAKLRLLTLCGQDEDGELEWMGKGSSFDSLGVEEESIMREFEMKQIWK